MKLILHINYSTNENEIIDEFINLNKSISIPSIYLEDNNRKKNMCESIVNKLILKYPNFVSPSRKHFLYNFNRDLLIEYFSTFNMDYTMADIDCKIFNILMTLNNQAKHNVITGKIIHPKKCDQYNFYLFYLEKHYIKSEIENSIKLL
jgi:patatin-like phospholipase/acyl hydrolase